MNTIDSGISQLHSYDNAIGNYQKPMVSQPFNDEPESVIRIHAPEIKKEPFTSNSFGHPLLSNECNSRFEYYLMSTPEESFLTNYFTITPPSVSNTSQPMVPYFGSKRNDHRPNDSVLSRFTGAHSDCSIKKEDAENFFKSYESKEKKILTSSGKGSESTILADVDRDRFKMNMKKKDDCFERVQVGPSLNASASIPASGGFQSYYRYVDHAKLRKYSYGSNMIGPLIEMTMPTFEKKTKTNLHERPHSTKPRTFDGSKDLQYSRLFEPSDREDTTTRPKHEVYFRPQNSRIDKMIVSASFQIPRNFVRTENIKETFNDQKKEQQIPPIPGLSLKHPINYNTPQTVLNNKREQEYSSLNECMSHSVAYATITHGESERKKERNSGPNHTMTIIDRNCPQIDFTSYTVPKKKSSIQIPVQHSIINNNFKNNLCIYPCITKNEKKQLVFETNRPNKQVQFVVNDTTMISTNKNKDKHYNFNNNLNGVIERPETTFTLNRYGNSEPDSNNNNNNNEEWPLLLLPNSKEAIESDIELKKTNRNMLCCSSNLEFGKTGQTVDVIPPSSVSVRKMMCNEWPQVSGPYSMNEKGYNEEQIDVRSYKNKITVKETPCILSRSFPNDIICGPSTSTRRRVIDNSNRIEVKKTLSLPLYDVKPFFEPKTKKPCSGYKPYPSTPIPTLSATVKDFGTYY